VGGKACNLAVLHRNGFDVPKGFVVTTEAYLQHTASEDISDAIKKWIGNTASNDSLMLEKASTAIRDIVAKIDLPDTLVEAIRTSYERLGGGPVAIRSSATAEDLPDASFAGQYDTFLNIEGLNRICETVKRCFASMWTSRAIAYRNNSDIPHDGMALAVVVQRMVRPFSAGVLFTTNPLSENNNQMMIESNFGLGDSVVSGQAVPDRFIIAKQAHGYSVVCKEIGTKDTKVDLNEDGYEGVKTIELPREWGENSSLNDEQAVHLAEVGFSIESLFGTPQDVEWAIDETKRLHILQSRPVTISRLRPRGDDEILWTRGYSDDYWNDDVTPLFFDLLGDQLTYIVNDELNDIMGYQNMPSELLKLYKAHAYFNVEVLKRKVLNEIPPFLRSDDLLNYFPEGAGPYGKETMRQLPFNLQSRLLAEIRVMLYDGNGSMTKTSSVYADWTENVFVPYCQELDREIVFLKEEGLANQLLEHADELDRIMMGHFRLVRYGIPVHNIGMNLITNYLLRRFLGEKAAATLFPILVSELNHKTNQTNKRLNELASLAGNHPELVQIISETQSEALYQRIQTTDVSSAQEFLQSYDDFIEDFGDRGFTREPYYPRWREAPEYVFDILKALLSGKGSQVRQMSSRVQIGRAQAERLVEKELRMQGFGSIKWMLFSTILNLARTYIVFRENQRFNLDRWITRNRRIYLILGQRLTDAGYLAKPIDIFFLHRNEIRRVVNGSTALSEAESRELAAQRHKDFKRYENVTPPKFLHGSREYNDPLPPSSDKLVGIPASQGVITGTIRVLNSVSDISQVRAGEILVVPRTDPGWTPVFSKIGGLITETGGILSHGAVVSREYGIPAITNVRKACQLLENGQVVTLNGSEGYLAMKQEGI
jgi:pyruvate,water dikinase